MPIAIIDSHRELESVARTFLDKAGARAEARALLDATDDALPSFWKEIAGLGWLGLHISEDFGGAGYGLPELVVILQEMGRADAPGPFLPTVMASTTIVRTATKEQQADLLPSLADGSKIGALGWTNSLSLKNGKLNGDGGLVLGGNLADLFVLTVGRRCGDSRSRRTRTRCKGTRTVRSDAPQCSDHRQGRRCERGPHRARGRRSCCRRRPRTRLS